MATVISSRRPTRSNIVKMVFSHDQQSLGQVRFGITPDQKRCFMSLGQQSLSEHNSLISQRMHKRNVHFTGGRGKWLTDVELS